jgi:signal recognition particle subunit SRP54
MSKMGGLQGIMGMLPGVAKMKAQMADNNINDKMIARQIAIINSMTKTERKKPDLLNASRKKRVAAGSGVEVQDINRLLKQHRQMADMVKSLSRGGGKNLQKMAAMMGGLPGMGGGGADMARLKAMGGGKMPEPSADEMKAIQDRLSGLGGGQLPGGLPGLPGLPAKK